MSRNAKPKTYWIDPRQSIATSLRHNDLAYATHGALQAMHVVRALNIEPRSLSSKTILDYGCGTGRIARVITPMFAHTYAYDPVWQTVAHGVNEASPLSFHSLTMTSNITQIPEVDYAFSVNVIEHLNTPDAQEMLDNLTHLVRGPTVLWYSPQHNHDVMSQYLTTEQRDFDHDFIHRKLGNIVVRVVDLRARTSTDLCR